MTLPLKPTLTTLLTLGILFFTFPHFACAQKYTISGTVEDHATGERLINASIFDPVTLKGVISNNFGFFSITLPAGEVSLVCSYVGFNPRRISFNLLKDTVIDIPLESRTHLGEVVVSAEKARSAIRNTQMSMTELTPETIKSIPVLLGEVDVLKALQLMPGVQSGNEGSSGIYVRGGGPDQNLFLLDGVPVYNVNHLFGFFSVFNTDAIQSVKLIKGGFPARYGGRLSSVLDIRLKDGNNKKFAAEGSIGLISSKLTLEGPIVRDKTSYIVSARRTYIDLLASPLIKAATAQNAMATTGGYFFYDMTAKINHRFSNRSRLFFSAYTGKDQAYVNTKSTNSKNLETTTFKLGWGNATAALRWNFIIGPKLFSNTTLTYSKYNFNTDIENRSEVSDTLSSKYGFSYDSGIRDWSGRVDFDYQPAPNHSVKFGYSQIIHAFLPGVTVYRMQEGSGVTPVDTTYGNSRIPAHELELYAEDDWQISPRLKVNAGVHASAFLVEDSIYKSFEPRISALYLANENLSFKAAFTRMSQYIHLLTNSTIGLPTDLWVPSTALIKPEKSTQYALGMVWNTGKGYELSVEGYFKSMDNLIEYKEGASYFSLQVDWQNKLAFGRGVAYGGEFLIRKTEGKTTGWIGYTLSRTDRKFEDISFGEWFPYRYDRRHDISIVLNHKFSNRIDIGATWVYGTGNAVTLPLENYQVILWPNWTTWTPIDYFETRNSYRMPAYHRLDIGVNFHKERKWGTRTWSFGIYNVYNRKNPFFIEGIVWSNDNTPKLRQYSLFPIIPSFSYSFRIK